MQESWLLKVYFMHNIFECTIQQYSKFGSQQNPFTGSFLPPKSPSSTPNIKSRPSLHWASQWPATLSGLQSRSRRLYKSPPKINEKVFPVRTWQTSLAVVVTRGVTRVVGRLAVGSRCVSRPRGLGVICLVVRGQVAWWQRPLQRQKSTPNIELIVPVIPHTLYTHHIISQRAQWTHELYLLQQMCKSNTLMVPPLYKSKLHQGNSQGTILSL